MRVPPTRSQPAAPAVLLGLAALFAFAAACEKQSGCRPGTVFVQVQIGAFITADQVDIGVSVEGSTPVHTQLHFLAGTRAGGVEVKFPNGYPSGKHVSITLSLSAGSGPVLATHTTDIVLTGECAAIDVDFGGPDGGVGGGGAGGGSGGSGGSAGSSGGRGGSGGSAGAGGTAGAGGSIGGTGGAGGGATAGTGGSAAGTGGGAAGRGGAGGTAGTGGATGRGGTGGMAGTGGATGRGGTGGGCVATGAENCFNGLDDDCDGRIDCADSDCSPTVAQCVALDPTGGKFGVVTGATTACPTTYPDATAINKGLSGGACTGCSCRVPTVTACTATVASYTMATDCANSANPGTMVTTFSSATTACTTPPNWATTVGGNILGVQVGTFTPTLSGACTPTGTATPGTVAWGASSRFCATAMMGGGCASGQVCVPVNAAAKCALFDGTHSCPAGTSADAWYTGETDSRSCGACACGSPTGQSCASMILNIGTDYSCGTITAQIQSGQRYCYPGNGVYTPGMIFSGTPTQPTSCPASAPLSGALAPTGPKTLCCLP